MRNARGFFHLKVDSDKNYNFSARGRLLLSLLFEVLCLV